MTKTAKAIADRLIANHFEDIIVSMKCNGDAVKITPCSFTTTITKIEDIEYYLVDSPSLPWLGGDTIDKIAEQLDRYEEYLHENDDSVEKLKAHIRKYGENSDWDCVSDWHKDLFGHRPHVSISRQIAWANSDSKESARFFVS